MSDLFQSQIESKYLCELDLDDEFFDSLKADYKDFSEWFKRKANERSFVTFCGSKITSFLLMKIEDESENYGDFLVPFEPARRLKICTFKVDDAGKGIGEEFLNLVMDRALSEKVLEVYLTVFDEYDYFIKFLKGYGFNEYTKKKTLKSDGRTYLENVLVKKIGGR